jgi:hypothetical protein
MVTDLFLCTFVGALLRFALLAPPSVQCNIQTSSDVRFVSTDVTLQRAARDGVRHIVVTDHLSAVAAQATTESQHLSLSSGFIKLQDTSKSIVVRPVCLM